ncbi:MAG: tyrosine-type recombinase/integrase [Actinomycetota bacterium]|jgi:integrase|nr:tyrosine-type recombinase/integrase [Actinomycetota bacterium]
MTGLQAALQDYLALRRSMGFKLARAEKLLGQFVDHCGAVGADVVTVELALQWATLPEDASRSWVCLRLCVARGFSRHLALVDERNEVVPTSLVPHRPTRATPYLYTEDDVRALMAAAGTLRSPIRQATFEVVVGLLWATGMRIGEALGLDDSDVDLAHGVLTVRQAKFGKSRELPIHESAVVALRAYVKRRDELFPLAGTPAFFVSAAGRRVRYDNFHQTYLKLVKEAGLVRRPPACRPRPHDLRHSFAVRTLTGWYRDGVDVEARIPRLSTYLGHAHPANTYWYLSAAPELLGLAVQRLEAATEVEP